MNTIILKLANRNVFSDIKIDLGIDAKDFEMLKDRHECEYKGLTFRQAKKLIIRNIFSNKKNLETYLRNNSFDYECELKENYLGETFLKETKELINFLKLYIKKNL